MVIYVRTKARSVSYRFPLDAHTHAHCRQRFPQSRAALSLLGFCLFHLQDYPSAVTAYEALLHLCPGVEEYKMVYAQALYNAGLYPEAMRASVRVEGPQYLQRKLVLQVRRELLGLGSARHGTFSCEQRLLRFSPTVAISKRTAAHRDELSTFHKTQSAIKYEMDELPACKALLDQCARDEAETLVNCAAVSFKEVSEEGERCA